MPKVIEYPSLVIEEADKDTNLPPFLTYVELQSIHGKENEQLMLIVDCLTPTVLYAYDYEQMSFNQKKIFENFDYSSDLYVHEMLCEAGVIEKMGNKLKCIPADMIVRYIGRVVYPKLPVSESSTEDK